MASDPFPRRIVCLTEETTETLYLLGEGDRVVGISGYTVRPPEARQKPKVSSFLHARFDKIEALAPDLILAFSDLQADITTELVKRGYPVFTFNQRSVAEILQMVRVLGGIVGVPDKAAALVGELEARPGRDSAVRRRASRAGRRCTSRSGTTRSSAASAGWRSWSRSPAARRSFPSCEARRWPRTASSAPTASSPPHPRCSSARGAASRCARSGCGRGPGGKPCRSSRDDRIFEVKSTYILQPGPAALTDGVRQLHAVLCGAVGVRACPPALQARRAVGRGRGRRPRRRPAARSARPRP